MITNKELQIEVDVLTTGSAAEIVIAILECLLYQRNQIPLIYKTYRTYVNNWLEKEKNDSDVVEIEGARAFQVQRQKDLAKQTKKSISEMRQIVRDTFDKKLIKSLRFLFGSTTFTPKESYTIHIPTQSISKQHSSDHHKIPTAKLNQTLITLLTSEELYTIFSNNLNPTNMYLELESLENNCSARNAQKSQIFPKEYSTLPPSCKDIHLFLVHKPPAIETPNSTLKCCKELEVFQDMIYLNLDVDDEQKQNDKRKVIENTATPLWWEADVFVRGFKNQPIKGYNLWSL